MTHHDQTGRSSRAPKKGVTAKIPFHTHFTPPAEEQIRKIVRAEIDRALPAIITAAKRAAKADRIRDGEFPR